VLIGKCHKEMAEFCTYRLPNERFPPCELVKNSFFRDKSGHFSVRPSMSFCILLVQEGSETVNVAGQHRKGNIAFESFDAIIMTYIQAMNLKCCDLFSVTMWETTTSTLFTGFLGLLMKYVVAPLTVILDNASFHKAKLVRMLLKVLEQKGLKLYFLPTYRPELNRIEKFWHKMKYE